MDKYLINCMRSIISVTRNENHITRVYYKKKSPKFLEDF